MKKFRNGRTLTESEVREIRSGYVQQAVIYSDNVRDFKTSNNKQSELIFYTFFDKILTVFKTLFL